MRRAGAPLGLISMHNLQVYSDQIPISVERVDSKFGTGNSLKRSEPVLVVTSTHFTNQSTFYVLFTLFSVKGFSSILHLLFLLFFLKILFCFLSSFWRLSFPCFSNCLETPTPLHSPNPSWRRRAAILEENALKLGLNIYLYAGEVCQPW